MATKNALFYSCKFNQQETIKSHRTKPAAIKAAGDYGMIFDVTLEKEFHVHAMSNDTLKAIEEGRQGYEEMDFKMKSVLQKDQLI